jgi:DNA-binding winged helix-turn-helix (wHTH) protein/TolB-like protein/tetratricopeptide (TPR) repeat protein
MSTQHPVVRFGTFELDSRSGELRRDGRRVPLQGQPAQVLCQLVSHPGELVSRDDLRRAIWAEDTFVDFDTALNVAINKVRQALQDSASAPRFIETVPRRGYRFLADVRELELAEAPPSAEAASTSAQTTATAPLPVWRRVLRPFPLAVIALAVASVTLAVLWRRDASVRSSPRLQSVAILPFRSVAGDAGDEALEAGMAEAVIIRLGELKNVRIPSLSTVRRHASRDPDPLAAGRALGMDAVLDATLLRVDSNLRVSARLLDVQKGTTLWARQWDLPWTDVFAVQDAMAAEVARTLALSLPQAEQASKRKRPTSVAAYERYLRGRLLLTRFTVPDSRRAAELLEETVKIDPASAAAHASLAFAYISIPLAEGPVKPFVELGRRAALRALELDPTLAEAHAVLGRITFSFDWDPEAAEPKMRQALQLDPDDPFTLHCFSMMLSQEGRFDESLSLNQRLLDQDPVATMPNRDRALILFVARRYQEAVEQAQKTLELDSHFPQAYGPLWRSYERLGRTQDMIETYLASLSLSKDGQAAVPALRDAARRRGVDGFWRRRIEQLLAQPTPPLYPVARAYMSLGDRDRALAWLEKIYEQRGAGMRMLKVNEEWDPLRGDPRFQDLQRRANVVNLALVPPSGSPGRTALGQARSDKQ